MLPIRTLALASLLTLAAAAPAGAAVSPPPGAIAQLVGSAGCVRNSAGEGCKTGRALDGAQSVVVSPDGRQVYVASSSSNGVAAFARDATTGTVTQLNAAAGCRRQGGAGGCGSSNSLAGAHGLAMSPDGRSLYVASATSDAVAVFLRASNGSLSVPSGIAACVTSNAATSGCSTAIGLDGASAVAVTPDGRFVYAAGTDDDAIAVFARNQTSGALTQVSGAGCVRDRGRSAAAGCALATGIDGPAALAVAPDGLHLYVASSVSSAITTFAIGANGGLTQLAGGNGCLRRGGGSGCAALDPIAGANSLAFSGDSRTLYVGAGSSDSIVWLSREPTTGVLTPIGCVTSNAGTRGCGTAPGLDGVRSLALSPAGNALYAASVNSDAVAVLQRGEGVGALSAPANRAACVRYRGGAGCTTGRALDGASGVAVAPTGAAVYASAANSDALSVFGPELGPSCTVSPPTVPANTATSILLACSDANGDALTRTVTAPPSRGTLGAINTSTGAATYTPRPGFSGTDSFAFTASDGLAATDPITVRITVSLPQLGPSIAIPTSSVTVHPDGTIRLRLGCPATSIGSCKITVTLRSNGVVTLPGRPAAHLAMGQRTLGVGQGRSAVTAVKLTTLARKVIRQRGKLKVYVKAVSRDRAPRPYTSTRTIVVHAPPKHK